MSRGGFVGVSMGSVTWSTARALGYVSGHYVRRRGQVVTGLWREHRLGQGRTGGTGNRRDAHRCPMCTSGGAFSGPVAQPAQPFQILLHLVGQVHAGGACVCRHNMGIEEIIRLGRHG